MNAPVKHIVVRTHSGSFVARLIMETPTVEVYSWIETYSTNQLAIDAAHRLNLDWLADLGECDTTISSRGDKLDPLSRGSSGTDSGGPGL